jgi:transposase
MKANESVEVVTEKATRRRRGKWTALQRRRIVADRRVAGAVVQEVAQRHGVRPSLLSAWRRQDDASHAAKPAKFAAVRVSAAPVDASIEIDSVGRCVRVRGIVDGAMLREVLAAARGLGCRTARGSGWRAARLTCAAASTDSHLDA